MTDANSWAFAEAQALAMELHRRAARRLRRDLAARRGMIPSARDGGLPGHSCPAGSRKCRANARVFAHFRVEMSTRLGASLAPGRVLAEVLNECQSCTRVAVICLTSSRRGPSGGRGSRQSALVARRHRGIEQSDQPRLGGYEPGFGLVLDRAKRQLEQRIRARWIDGPADRLPGRR